MIISIPFLLNNSLNIQNFTAIFQDWCLLNSASHQSYFGKQSLISPNILRKALVGQNCKYFDHVYCIERGQQMKFYVANHFGNKLFPPLQQRAQDSNTTRFDYARLLQLQETIKTSIVYCYFAEWLSLLDAIHNSQAAAGRQSIACQSVPK